MVELTTRWGKAIDKDHVLQEYPRPQMVRESYMNLNGEWEYAISNQKDIQDYHGKILVPFSPEARLSGVNHILQPDEYLHYQLEFEIPNAFIEDRVLLHFGAVDQECAVFVNGEKVGIHKGGYLPFSFDITPLISPGRVNILAVRVIDQTEYAPHARGKQKLHKKGAMDAIFYTPSSGIWKSVWLESVPETYIQNIQLTPHFDTSSVGVYLETNQAPKEALVQIYSEDSLVKEVTIQTDKDRDISLEGFKSWHPDNPHLYDVKIQYGEDTVSTYFGMRKFSKEKDKNGIYRFYLNNQPYYFNGLLDQGYWPESLLTAPSDEALIYDILKTKELGFNTIRKHVKIESERFYYHCDKLGMIVLQDMPNGGDDILKPFVMYLPNISDRLSRNIGDQHYKLFGRTNAAGREQYTKDLKAMVKTLYNYPSIAMWIPFNEGWGQFDANKATKTVRTIDSTRLIAETSGWFDQGDGDVYSIHNYMKKLKVHPKDDRVVALTEFGGYALPIENHVPAEKEFGYQSYASFETLEENYRKLWEEQILPQIASGLSATIYTQTTDIEEEINGLMTYDREVLKMDKKLIQSLNRALYHVFESITHN